MGEGGTSTSLLKEPPTEASHNNYRRAPGGRIERRGDTTYAYDAQGRLISKRTERKGFRPKKWQYQWDGEDQLRRVTTPDDAVWEYRYDPFGRRMGKACIQPGNKYKRQAQKVSYLWAGNLLSEERRIYADGSEQVVAYHYEQDSFRPIAQEVDGELSYIVTDHLGTPKELLSEEGELRWSASHRLWGGVAQMQQAANDADGNKVTCLLRFQGQLEDEESGLYYNRFRYYDPESGGYVSSDPIGLAGGLTLHGYVGNPCGWVDPFGLAKTSVANRGLIDKKLGGATGSKGIYRFVDSSGRTYVGSVTDQDFKGRLNQHLIDEKINSDGLKSLQVIEMNDSTAQQIYDAEAREIARNGGRSTTKLNGETSNNRRPAGTGNIADDPEEMKKRTDFPEHAAHKHPECK